MTSTLSARPHAAGGVAPVARVSASALRQNIARAATSHARDDLWTADAWGHGAGWVASVLSEAGADADLLDPAVLFGLPGTGARPVMALHGRALGTKPLLAGEGVSYGYTHRAPADTVVALVTGGYAQGVVRSLGNAASVVIAGRRHPIVGRVAMDVCVVDVRDATIMRGADVAFFGDPSTGDPSLSEWVDATGLSAAEIVATVGARADRQVTA